MLRQRYGRWEPPQSLSGQLPDHVPPLQSMPSTGLLKDMRTRSEHGANVRITNKLEATRGQEVEPVKGQVVKKDDANAVVVVVAVDFSNESIGALRWALATKLVRGEMRVVLLHVIKAYEYRWESGRREKVFRMPQPPHVSGLFRPPTKRALNWQETIAEVEAVMEPLIRMCNGYETPCQVVVVECPERVHRRRAILDGAANLKAAFLVLGSGSGRVSRSFFQLQLSIPAYCAKYPPANCNVLMVHNNEMVLSKNSTFSTVTNISGPKNISAPTNVVRNNVPISSEKSVEKPMEKPQEAPQPAAQPKGLLELLDRSQSGVSGQKSGKFVNIPDNTSEKSQKKSGTISVKNEGSVPNPGLLGVYETKSDGGDDESSDDEKEAEAEVERLRAMLARAELVAKIAQIDAEEAVVREKAAEARREAMEAMIEKERLRREQAEQVARNLQMEVALKLERQLEASRVFSSEEIDDITNALSETHLLGGGAFGNVYRGFFNEREVAVRILALPKSYDPSRLLDEIQSLRWIRHPNIVPLIGCCPEKLALVNLFMPSGTLAERLSIKTGPEVLTWKGRMQIAVDVASALLFLHTAPKPVVYSILSPSKILLDSNLQARLSDAGLPSLFSEPSYVRREAGVAYLDPEYQSTGILAPKSDVYSLGVLILQLLINKPPFGLRGVVEDAISEKFLMGIIDPAMRDAPEELAKEVARLALQCSEMRRRDRPDLKNDILPLLQRALAGETSGLHTTIKDVTTSTSQLQRYSSSISTSPDTKSHESSLAKYCMPGHYQAPTIPT